MSRFFIDSNNFAIALSIANKFDIKFVIDRLEDFVKYQCQFTLLISMRSKLLFVFFILVLIA